MDAREIGQRIRRLRCGRRLTQEALADFAGRSGRWLWNVEQGRASLTLRDVERLALGLRVDEAVLCGHAPMPPWLPRGAVGGGDGGVSRVRAGGQLLGDHRLLLVPEEAVIRVADLSAQIAALVAGWTPEMKRRAFLRRSGLAAASLPIAVAAGSLEGIEHLVLGTEPTTRAQTMAAEQYREIIGICRRLGDLGMSAAVLQVGRRAVAGVDELIRDCTSAAARRPLTLLAGELCQIVGFAAAGLHDGETARRYTDRALAAAGEASSPDLHAHTVSLNLVEAELYHRRTRDPGAAAAAATAGEEWARRSGNPAVVSFAHTHAAVVQARAGCESAALGALEEAERYLERSTPEERPTWLYWYGHARLLGDRGECLLELSRAGRSGGSGIDETVAVLRSALAAGGGYPADQAWRHLDLADAYWEHGEREEAIRHASDALVLGAGMEWRRIHERLEGVDRRMEGDPLPAARDFRARFRTLLAS